MRTKHIVLAVAILLAAITQLWAIPDVPILQVDTLCNLGKVIPGEASGAFFLPDGNIIAVIRDTPFIIDSKTGEILRTLEKSPIESVLEPKLSKDGTKLVASVMGPKFIIWDIPSGTVIKISDVQMVHFCLSPDGTKMYVTLPNKTDNPGLIAVYDMATFQEIERLSYPGLIWAGHIDISPDGQTLAVSVEKTPYGQSDTMTNQFILINLNDKKNYTVVETLESGIVSMEYSPDGKQIAFLHTGGEYIYIYIYNIETEEKKYINEQELSTMFGFNIMSFGNPFIIENNTILFDVIGLEDKNYYFLVWNNDEKRVKYYINSKNNYSVDVKDSTILLCNQGGVVSYLDKNIVPVKDLAVPNENYLTYDHNQLEFYSDIAFIGESSIYDTTGKLIVSLGSQPFIMGKNLIRVNKPLPVGIYILTINNKDVLSSYKFIVE